MGLNKVMKQLCVTAALVVLSTVTAFAANVGQASGTNVNVRAGASTGANVLGKINKGTEYTVLDKVDNWFKISYNGATGYVFADYFSVTKADGSITGSGVNLREKATTASNSLKKFSSGEAVTVTGQNDDWYRVSYNGGSAYVSKDYVSGNLLHSCTCKRNNKSRGYLRRGNSRLRLKAAQGSIHKCRGADGSSFRYDC